MKRRGRATTTSVSWPRQSRGRGRGRPCSFYFSRLSRTGNAGWEGLQEFLLAFCAPFAERNARSKAVGGSAGCPGALGAQPMVSLADSHRPPQGWFPPLVRTALCLPYRRDVLFKGRPVAQPGSLIQTPQATLEFSPRAQGQHPGVGMTTWAAQHVASVQGISPREQAVNPA